MHNAYRPRSACKMKLNIYGEIALICFLGEIINCACTSQLQFNLPGQSNDVAVSSTSNVYASTNVSGSGRVYRLNGSLVQQEVLQFPSGTSVLRIALSSDESRLIVCVSNKSCLSYIANDFTKGSVSAFPNSLTSSNNAALVSAPVIGGGSSFYVGSSNGTVILIGQYGLDGAAGSVSRSSGNLFNVSASSFTRNWFGGFVAGSYTYFIAFDVSTSPISRPGVRVLRVCDNSNTPSVAAMYEIELDCLNLAGNVNSYARFAGASVVSYPTTAGGPLEDRLVIGIVTPPLGGYTGALRSRVCTYSLSQIDSKMDSAYAQCSSGSLPWRSSSATSTCSAPCNLSSPGAIAAPTLVYASVPVPVAQTNTSYELSYTLSFRTESLTLLFLAFTSQLNQQGTSVIQAVSEGVIILTHHKLPYYCYSSKLLMALQLTLTLELGSHHGQCLVL